MKLSEQLTATEPAVDAYRNDPQFHALVKCVLMAEACREDPIAALRDALVEMSRLRQAEVSARVLDSKSRTREFFTQEYMQHPAQPPCRHQCGEQQ